MRKSRGFTLIELLVVIAIIAVLMGVLLPSLARARNQAKMVACQALLKQWGTIWSMFCDDNNGKFSIGQAAWTRGQWIVDLRSQYHTKTNILNCPLATKRLPSGDIWGGPLNAYAMPVNPSDDVFSGGGEEPSFGVNTWIYNQSGGIASNYWRTKDSSGAAMIPVFADTMWRGGGPTSVKGTASCDPPASSGQWVSALDEMKHFCIDRHNGSINMVFMDWHVDNVPLKRLWKLKWHKNFDVHNAWTLPDAPWPAWMRNLSEG